MGLVFDINAARLYESWHTSPQGRAMERSAEKLILALVDPQPGERVLDIGCGTGNNLLYFSRLGLDISGIDASVYMINRAKERLGNRCSLKIGFAEDLPFEDNEFDLAVLINTLEFVDDPVQALREAGRVANRRIFIGVLNSLSWHCLVVRMHSLFHRSLFDHVRFYNIWELKSYVHMSYGHVPVNWRCAQVRPQFVRGIGGSGRDLWDLKHCPFGAFLGLSATILYWVKTDNAPLKIEMTRAGQPATRGLNMGKLERMEGVQGHERGLPL